MPGRLRPLMEGILEQLREMTAASLTARREHREEVPGPDHSPPPRHISPT